MRRSSLVPMLAYLRAHQLASAVERPFRLAPALASAIPLALFLVLLVPDGASTSSSPAGSEDPDVRSLVEAERAFAKLSLEKGIPPAFLANLAEDAIIFRPGPTPAVPWYKAQPPSSSVLEWAPEFAAVAAGGDLGYTSGPWTYKRDTSAAPITGHFVSVWRRSTGGTWKVILDAGVQHGPSAAPAGMSYGPRPVAAEGPIVDRDAAREALIAAERALLASSAEKGWIDAFGARAAEDVRVYLSGEAPAVGRDAARALLARHAGTFDWKASAAVTSTHGDVGFVYGTAERRPAGARPDSVEASAFLRIWRQRADGAYEIALALASPMPPPKAAERPEPASKPAPNRKP